MSDAAPLPIGRRENQIILDKISHGPRPRVTLQVWWAALACAAPDTGTIRDKAQAEAPKLRLVEPV